MSGNVSSVGETCDVETQREIKKYRILYLRADDVYDVAKKGEPLDICDSGGGIDYGRFESFIYDSLETKHLEIAYKNAVRSRKVKGKFAMAPHDNKEGEKFTLSVINLVFRNKEQRSYLYENGFEVRTGSATNRYVRYKRSAGSSRVGNCLFILEPLKREMMLWSSCGLEENQIRDRVSWESYISLTLSNTDLQPEAPP